MYPHYLCGKGKDGHTVYYERPGEIELPQVNLVMSSSSVARLRVRIVLLIFYFFIYLCFGL
jgi:hypothetical protein